MKYHISFNTSVHYYTINFTAGQEVERKKAKKLREICRDKNKIKRCSEKCAVIFTTDLRYGKLKTEVKYFDLVWSCKVYAFY